MDFSKIPERYMYGITNPSAWNRQDKHKRIIVGDFKRDKFKILDRGRVLGCDE